MDPKARFKAAIFDFDGVIADTVPLHFASYRELFADEGVDFNFDDYKRIANGTPRHRVIRAVMGENLASDKFDALMKRKEEIVLRRAADGSLVRIDGALELAERLRALGLRTGVASSSRTAARFLNDLGATSLFDAVVDANHAARHKPHPDLFLAAAEKIGVEPDDCLVFEDAPVGIEAALAAKMKIVAITTTTTRDALEGAHWIIDTFVGFDPAPILFG